jgi:hypothetical protein
MEPSRSTWERDDGSSGEPPAWLGGVIEGIRHEVQVFLATVAAVSLHPATFAEQWRDCRREAPNPLAFLGTALAVSSPPTLMVSHFARLQEDGGTLWDAFLSDQVAPYVQYVLLGVLAHGLLRLLGGTQKLRATVAIALYSGGGPAMVVDLFTLPLDVALKSVAASPDSLTNGVLQGLAVASIAAANVAFFVTFAIGLGGLHRLRLLRPALALAVAYFLLAVLRVGFFELLARMR